MRSEFEKLLKLKDHIVVVIKKHLLKGCEAAYKHQQSKVDEAEAKAQMCRDEKNHAINRWSAVCKERDELQKRVDAVNLVLEGLKNANYMNSGNKAYNPLLIEKLEQALKGAG